MPYIKIRGQKEVISINEQDYYLVDQAKLEALENVQLSVGGFAVSDIRGWVLKDSEETVDTFNFKERNDTWVRERVDFLENSPKQRAELMVSLYSTFCRISSGVEPTSTQIEAFKTDAQTFYEENRNRYYPDWEIFKKNSVMVNDSVTHYGMSILRALSQAISTDREYNKVIIKYNKPDAVDLDPAYQAFKAATQPDRMDEIRAESVFPEDGDNSSEADLTGQEPLM